MVPDNDKKLSLYIVPLPLSKFKGYCSIRTGINFLYGQ